jgi:broad specificity phosphatase PhoE
LEVWLERYDNARTLVGEFDLGGVAWQACVSSDLPRARITASAVFRGEVAYSDLLREVQFSRFKTGNLRLPVWMWRWLLQLCWSTGHMSQRVVREEFRRRVLVVADWLDQLEQDILVVSHAGMMAYLSAELRRRGFIGPKLRMAKHARTYIYEKTQR